MASLGSALLALAFATALAAAALALAGRNGDRRRIDLSRRAVYGFFGLLTACVAIIEIAFASNDFSFNIVQQHSSIETPTFYKLAAMWSSQEGSLLLWAWVLSIVSSAALFATRSEAEGDRPLGDRGDDGRRRLLHRPDAVRARRRPLRHAEPGAGRRHRPQPAAAAPEHDDPPADALLGLRLPDRALRLRHRRPDHPPPRRRMDPLHPPLRPDRLGPPRLRPPARRPLVLHRARLGRLLGLGPGRERGADAVAGDHRLPALDHGPGEAGDAESLERLPGRRLLLAGPARHLPRPLRGTAVDPRLRRQHRRPLHPRPDRGGPDRLDGADRLPPRRPALGEADRLAGLARVGLPGQQPAAGGADRGRSSGAPSSR